MSKILIFTDLHVHSHKNSTDRLQNCLDALEWVFKTSEEEKIKTILFLGDLFHERQKIDIQTYQKTFEVFEKYMSGKKIYLLLGNHDLWHYQKWDISSVIPLRSINGVNIIDKPCTLDIEGHEISFLPYTHDPSSDLSLIQNNSKFKILCGHVAVDGAVWNVMHDIKAEVNLEHDGEMFKVGPEIFNGFNRVFLGHYHGEQKLNDTVEYVGSPLQLSFGEAFQHKNILIYDLENDDRKYIRNTFSPQHFIIPEKDVDKYELNKNFIKVIVEDTGKSDIIDLRNKMVKEGVGSLQIKFKEKEKEDTGMIMEASGLLNRQSEMLVKYMEMQEKNNNLAGLNKKLLMEIGESICKAENE